MTIKAHLHVPSPSPSDFIMSPTMMGCLMDRIGLEPILSGNVNLTMAEMEMEMEMDTVCVNESLNYPDRYIPA